MAKKLFAVTNVKAEEFYEAGSQVDQTKFTAEQLKELYDAGAVELRDVDDEPKEEAPKAPVTPVTPVTQQSVGPDTTVKAPEKK